jgi:hypothetical protein
MYKEFSACLCMQVDRRCIVAATLKASGTGLSWRLRSNLSPLVPTPGLLPNAGLDLQLSMKKGEVDHNCEPACVLHELEDQGGATGEGNRALQLQMEHLHALQVWGNLASRPATCLQAR